MMLVRITRKIPAPVMDGFDVRNLRPGKVYDLDARTANYLIIAGYAVRADTTDPRWSEDPGRQ